MKHVSVYIKIQNSDIENTGGSWRIWWRLVWESSTLLS